MQGLTPSPRKVRSGMSDARMDPMSFSHSDITHRSGGIPVGIAYFRLPGISGNGRDLSDIFPDHEAERLNHCLNVLSLTSKDADNITFCD